MNPSICNRRSLAAAIAGLVALAAAGCGGAGGPAATSAAATTEIAGVVQSVSGAAVPNAVVRFDNVASISSPTDSAGKFELAAPSGEVAAGASLWAYNSSGTAIATENLSDPAGPQVLTVGESATNNDLPPAPPSLDGSSPAAAAATSGSDSPPSPPTI